MIYEEVKKAIRANELYVEDLTIIPETPFFISSGIEFSVNNLTLESGAVIRNRGFLSIKGNLDNNGEIQNEGIVELGW